MSLFVTSKALRSKNIANTLNNLKKTTHCHKFVPQILDIREGDSAEDVEARGLLNKFLGAQVILSGIESNVKASTTTSNAKRSTKVTTTITVSFF